MERGCQAGLIPQVVSSTCALHCLQQTRPCGRHRKHRLPGVQGPVQEAQAAPCAGDGSGSTGCPVCRGRRRKHRLPRVQGMAQGSIYTVTMENTTLIPHKTNNKTIISSVQSLIHVRLFATPWTVAHQASLSITNSEFTQTHVHYVSDIQPSHPVIAFSSRLQSFPASESFPMSQFFASGGQSIGVSASLSVLQINIQG